MGGSKTSLTVFVSGGSGFVGREVVKRLLESGYPVKALARRAGGFPTDVRGRLELVPGDALSPDSLRGTMEGCGAVINLIGIIREKRRRGVTFQRMHVETVSNLLDEAERSGVERFIQMSAIGAGPAGATRYLTTKFRGEEEVKRRAPEWTIFRPSIIVGPGTGFISEIKPLLRLPVVPVFGSGEYLLEPLDKRVVADAFVGAVENPRTGGAVYELRGPRSHTYNEILDVLGRTLGRVRVRKVHVPLWFARPLVAATGWLPFSPVTKDQLEMLVSSKPGQGRDGVSELGLRVIDLAEQLDYALGGRDDRANTKSLFL
jgi:uncharacterized protein YbjT (DUF2867 family)